MRIAFDYGHCMSLCLEGNKVRCLQAGGVYIELDDIWIKLEFEGSSIKIEKVAK